MKLTLVLISILFVCLSWARMGWLAGIEEGRSLSRADAIRAVQADMSKHCTCWFTGSKCKTPNPTVICTKPEWMK